MHLGKRAHLDRIVDDEGRLDKRAFTEFTENFVDQLAFTHRFVYFEFQFLADRTYLVFALAVQVVACLFLDGVQDRQTAVRCFEIDGFAVDNAFACAVDGDTDTFQ